MLNLPAHIVHSTCITSWIELYAKLIETMSEIHYVCVLKRELFRPDFLFTYIFLFLFNSHFVFFRVDANETLAVFSLQQTRQCAIQLAQMDPLAHFPIFPDQLASPSPSPPSSINFVTSLPHHFEVLNIFF